MTKKEVLDWLYRIKSKLTVYFPLKWVGKSEQAIDYAIKALENQKTGHWILDVQSPMGGMYKCSECGRRIYLFCEDNLEIYPYCHCGAKMEGE